MPAGALAISDGPPEAILWTLKGGLTPEVATAKYGMKWHEKTRRVLIPIKGGLLGRAVFGERPKYRMLGTSGVLYWPKRRPLVPVIAVEDILSAIAIDRAGGTAVAVLGTSISPEQAAEIADGRDKVIGWFDGDAAGDKAYTRLRGRMGLHPVTVSRIRTDKDPKVLHRRVIRGLIAEHKGDSH